MIGSLAVGGAETQLVRLVNGLDRGRFQPSIVCMSERGQLADAVARDVPITAVLATPLSQRPRQSRMVVGARILSALFREFRRQRPAVVHAYLPAAYVPASLAAWSARVPVIASGRRGLTAIDIYGAVRWRLLAEMANRIIDVQVCNSNAVRDYVASRERIHPERMRVVYNGIDIPPLTHPNLPREWTADGAQAVMIANFIRYKGHREVLHAVKGVVRLHPTFRLVLIGDGPEGVELQRRAHDLGIERNVVFAGRRADAAGLIQGFDFTVLGSSEEGFPNALMESMAGGVPVVSTAVGGVPELVEDGAHGRLVTFGDVEGMSRAMTWMIEHPEARRRMGEAARRRIADQFSTDRMLRSTEAVYEEFLRAR